MAQGAVRGQGSAELGGRVGAEGGAGGCSSSRRSLCPGSLLVQGMAWPGVLSLPGNAAWKASFAASKGQEAALGTLVSVPLAERRVRGPDAGVQARVPVQVTENRPIGTCTAYPGLLERGHGLARALVLLLAPVASFPQDRECLIPAPCPGVS